VVVEEMCWYVSFCCVGHALMIKSKMRLCISVYVSFICSFRVLRLCTLQCFTQPRYTKAVNEQHIY
jgi:hypothetical protein